MKNINNTKYRVYGIIGMLGLVLIGVVIGLAFAPKPHFNRSMMTEQQCKTIYERMDYTINHSNYEKYEELSKIFAKNCQGYPVPEIEEKVEEKHIENMTTCQKIESVLLLQLNDGERYMADVWAHTENAKIYANLSERGCSENSEKYKELAKQELEIARALTDDNVEYNTNESIAIVETYKRLQMQAEAERMIEKAKKLTNPAIDFIIQLEKIIEE